MAEYTHEELRQMTVAQLRDIASKIEHDAVTGHSQMRKDEIIHAICEALDIEEAGHHGAAGLDKGQAKRRIRALKDEREAALQAGDANALKMARKRIRRLKRRIRKAMA